jgi:hypothetical protein
MLVRWRMQWMTNSALQLIPCRRYSLDWSLSTFLLPFIRLFLTLPLKPCGYFTFLIMMQNFPFSPNLYTTAWHVLLNDLHDLRLKEMQTGFSFFRLTLLGMGLQKSKWIPNSLPLRLLYLLDNDETRVILTQPLHHRMPVLRNVSRDLQARRTSCLDKLADLSAGWLACKYTTKTCKKCNESKTPHTCWLQDCYLEYEWGFPRVQLFQTDIKTSQKASITATSAFVCADLLERLKWLLAVWI